MISHIKFQENFSNSLGGVELPNFFLMRTSKGGDPAIRARSRKGETCVSLFSKVYIFIKFHGSHLKI